MRLPNRLRLLFLLVAPLLLARPASTQSTSGPIPTTMEECEPDSCATWSFHGKQGIGRWISGAVADLTIEQFDSEAVSISRDDRTGTGKGIQGRYVGTRKGDHIEGTFTWVWPGGPFPKGSVNWYAIIEPQAQEPERAVPGLVAMCEDSDGCSTWSFQGKEGQGQWSNGASAKLAVEHFGDNTVSIRRVDRTGFAQGLTAFYSGTRKGDHVEGTVIWSYQAQARGQYVAGSTNWRANIGSAEWPTGRINVIHATYGGNCGAPFDNDLPKLKAACDHEVSCGYPVKTAVIGDPAYGCVKWYFARYSCAPDSSIRTAFAGAEADGSTVKLDCMLPAAASSGFDEVRMDQNKFCAAKRTTEAMQHLEDRLIRDPNGAMLEALACEVTGVCPEDLLKCALIGACPASVQANVIAGKIGSDNGKYTSKDPGSFVCMGLFSRGEVRLERTPEADGASELTQAEIESLLHNYPTFVEWFKVKPLLNGRYNIEVLSSSIQLAGHYAEELTYP